jgi:hypothetical protein
MACGACDEDKIAATYDHGVVTRAAAGGEVMVLSFAVDPKLRSPQAAVAAAQRAMAPRTQLTIVRLLTVGRAMTRASS